MPENAHSGKNYALVLVVLSFFGTAIAHEPTRPRSKAMEGGLRTSAIAGQSCSLKIELRDSKTGASIPGIIRVLDANGEPLALPGLLDRCIGLPREFRKIGWYVLMKPTAITVPTTAVTVEAISGLETERQLQSIDLKGKTEASISLDLKRFWNGTNRGLVAGNTHLHLKDLSKEEADRYLKEIARSDGLEIVFVSYLERALVDRTYITNVHSPVDLKKLSSDKLLFGNGEEYRHNIDGGGEGYGHVMFLDLKNKVMPASIGPGITKQGYDDAPLRGGITKARHQEATVIWCHNQFGFEDLPSWISGLVDAQNIFDGGNRGSYENTFYRYLNLGMRVPFSSGTDWFIYDFSRVYAELDFSENHLPTIKNWLTALRAGKTFITNGPLLEFSVGPDQTGPGGKIEMDAGGNISLSGRAVGRHDFGMLQVVQDGEVIATAESRAEGTHFVAEIQATALVSQSGWFALRIDPAVKTTNEMGRPLFAHTSSVTVKIGGHEIFDPTTAQEVIAEIEKNLYQIQEKGIFSNASRKARVEHIYLDAIKLMREKLSAASQ